MDDKQMLAASKEELMFDLNRKQNLVNLCVKEKETFVHVLEKLDGFLVVSTDQGRRYSDRRIISTIQNILRSEKSVGMWSSTMKALEKLLVEMVNFMNFQNSTRVEKTVNDLQTKLEKEKQNAVSSAVHAVEAQVLQSTTSMWETKLMAEMEKLKRTQGEELQELQDRLQRDYEIAMDNFKHEHAKEHMDGSAADAMEADYAERLERQCRRQLEIEQRYEVQLREERQAREALEESMQLRLKYEKARLDEARVEHANSIRENGIEWTKQLQQLKKQHGHDIDEAVERVRTLLLKDHRAEVLRLEQQVEELSQRGPFTDVITRVCILKQHMQRLLEDLLSAPQLSTSVLVDQVREWLHHSFSRETCPPRDAGVQHEDCPEDREEVVDTPIWSSAGDLEGERQETDSDPREEELHGKSKLGMLSDTSKALGSMRTKMKFLSRVSKTPSVDASAKVAVKKFRHFKRGNNKQKGKKNQKVEAGLSADTEDAQPAKGVQSMSKAEDEGAAQPWDDSQPRKENICIQHESLDNEEKTTTGVVVE